MGRKSPQLGILRRRSLVRARGSVSPAGPGRASGYTTNYAEWRHFDEIEICNVFFPLEGPHTYFCCTRYIYMYVYNLCAIIGQGGRGYNGQ